MENTNNNQHATCQQKIPNVMATGRCENCRQLIPHLGVAYCDQCASALHSCKYCGGKEPSIIRKESHKY